VKIFIVAGWVLLAIEAVIIAGLAMSPNIGDDAAGRGAARGFALVLGLVLVAAGALFLWGQRGGPRPAFWIGLGIMALPLVVIGRNVVAGQLGRFDRAMSRARDANFEDARLARIAGAIETDDATTVKLVLAQGALDFDARNGRGRTILGRAIEHAIGADGTTASLDAVRHLLAAGARPIPNAIEPEFTNASIDAHLLVAHLVGATSANAVPVLDMVLAAGADPNTRNSQGAPLYFEVFSQLPRLEVLAKHGADFTALEHTRSDRMGWTAAMVAAQLEKWDQVSFFLDHGVSAEHTASDGTSLKTILETKRREGRSDPMLASIAQRLKGRGEPQRR
jgi:hypothetical protein